MNGSFSGNPIAPLTGRQVFPFPGALESPPFPPSSRYHGLKVLSYASPDGETIAYLERRFLPDPKSFEQLFEHTVVEGDRMDNLSHRYYGDVDQYFRIADANGAMFPEELTSLPGAKIRITLPEGIPGAPRA